jgi:hypothetical protein
VPQLYNMRLRYYDPKIGLFTTQDPLFNNSPYTFAQNNPLKFKDPFGLLACEREAAELSRINWNHTYVSRNLARTEEMIREISARLKEIEKLEELKGGWMDFVSGLVPIYPPGKDSVSFYQGRARMYQGLFNVGIPVVSAFLAAGFPAASAIGRAGVGIAASGAKDIASSDFGVMSPSAMVSKLREAEAGLKLKIDRLNPGDGLRSSLNWLEETRDRQRRELADLENEEPNARMKYSNCHDDNIRCGVRDIATYRSEFP